MGRLGSASDFKVYLITDGSRLNGIGLVDAVTEALKGGVRAVQLREKSMSAKGLLDAAKALRRVTDGFKARLFVNDRLDVAMLSNADGVHLGQGGIGPRRAREFLGKRRLIGVSCHSMKEAVLAEEGGADFITFGPVYFTESKAGYGSPLGIHALREATRAVGVPVYAIGGVSKDRAQEVMSAGAHGIAVIGAVFGSPDIRKGALDLVQAVSALKGK
jgi:thiamine-phosphate pyrophosphorylase